MERYIVAGKYKLRFDEFAKMNGSKRVEGKKENMGRSHGEGRVSVWGEVGTGVACHSWA